MPWTEEPGWVQNIGSQDLTQLKRLSMHATRKGLIGRWEKAGAKITKECHENAIINSTVKFESDGPSTKIFF